MISAATRGPLVGWLLTGSLIMALGGGAAGVLLEIERQRPASVRAAELSYLPKGDYLKVAVLGYRQMAADVIWLAAVQHFGERYQTEEGYLWAYHAVDVITDLDPKFVFAYQAAGIVLSVWAELPYKSVAILAKGMRHNPEVWQLPFYLGYDYFYELHDTEMAAKYFRIAAQLPGSPAYLPKLAARMTVEAGDPEAALEFLERMYRQIEDERLREGLEKRMKEVVAERDIRFLEEGVRRYQARYGEPPAELEDLVSGEIILEIPPEPFGGRYTLNASDGSVMSPGLRERLLVHRKYMGKGPRKK